MNRKWLYIVGAVVALVLLLIILLPFALDANQYRPRIEAALDASLNRKVSMGNIHLAIFSGGVSVDNISIADDPAFSSGNFLEAKSLNVGVELMPLIFSHALNVTGISIDDPQVTLLRSSSGAWNFSTLGATATKPGGAAGAQTAGTNFSVQKLTLRNGTVFVGDVAGAGNKKDEYQQVNLDASNISYSTQFPFDLTAKTAGSGTLKLSGKMGPIDQADTQETPLDANLEVHNVDLTSTGFMDPASGIAGVVDFTGALTSDGQQMNFKGKLSGNKLQLVQGGSPARVPVQIDFDAGFAIKARTGTLQQGDVHVGKALAHLTGTYSTAQQTPSIKMKLDGQNMPAPDLEGMLPALGVVLPAGASIQSGSVNASLNIDGPVDRLVTSGPVSLSNAKLAGFDLGTKMGALSSFAGVPKGTDTVIQTLSADLRIAPEGIRADKLLMVVPPIGSISGNGTIAANHALDFKMTARLSNSGSGLGGLANVVSVAGGQSGGIPFMIHGTTSNPTFEPDVNAVVGGLAKGVLSGGPKNIPGQQNLGQAIGGLFGKKKGQ